LNYCSVNNKKKLNRNLRGNIKEERLLVSKFYKYYIDVPVDYNSEIDDFVYKNKPSNLKSKNKIFNIIQSRRIDYENFSNFKFSLKLENINNQDVIDNEFNKIKNIYPSKHIFDEDFPIILKENRIKLSEVHDEKQETYINLHHCDYRNKNNTNDEKSIALALSRYNYDSNSSKHFLNANVKNPELLKSGKSKETKNILNNEGNLIYFFFNFIIIYKIKII
jgi:hypothetical protein